MSLKARRTPGFFEAGAGENDEGAWCWFELHGVTEKDS